MTVYKLYFKVYNLHSKHDSHGLNIRLTVDIGGRY